MLMPNARYDQLYPIKFTRIQSPKLVIAGDTIVLKTGPDQPIRPVQPGTGLQSGPVMTKNQKSSNNRRKPKTGRFNRRNRKPVWLNRLLAGLLKTPKCSNFE